MGQFVVTNRQVFYVALPLLLIALFINLGSHHVFVHTDEPRRAIVSLEMIFSGDFLTPTIYGEFYYNKPPLFNWLIIASYKIFGSYSEWALRVPSVLALLLLTAVIFLINRRFLGFEKAALVALAFVTSTRLLFYDSFLGMIDLPFSLLIYPMFMAIFYFGEKKKYLSLFMTSYLLMALGFLVKGLPAVAFQGLTLFVYFLFFDRFKRLFYWQHFVRGLTAVGLLALYYLAYFNATGVDPGTIGSVIFSESSKRTIVRFGIEKTLLHLIKFPIDTLANFTPWSLLVVLLFFKKVRKDLFKNRFIKFNMLCLLANIIIYWTSPEVVPRYLFMMLPLFLSVLIESYYLAQQQLPKVARFYQNLFLGLSGLLALAALVIPLVESGRNAPEGVLLGPLFFFVVSVAIVYLMFKNRHGILFGLALLIIIMRLEYSSLLLPQRAFDREHYRQGALKVAEITKGKPLWLYRGNWLQDGSTYYISRERQDILRKKKHGFDESGFYIMSFEEAQDLKVESVYQFYTLFYKNPLQLVYWDGSQ